MADSPPQVRSFPLERTARFTSPGFPAHVVTGVVKRRMQRPRDVVTAWVSL